MNALAVIEADAAAANTARRNDPYTSPATIKACAKESAAARDAIAELIAYADSALHYVDEAAKIERERHQKNGAPSSQVLAQTVADRLRAALAAVGVQS